MTNIIAVIEQIIMLFCITMVGYYMQRKGVMTDPVIKGINVLLLRVAWPCMILMTTQKECKTETLTNFLFILLITFLLLSLATIFTFWIMRKKAPSGSAAVFTVLSILPNAGFVGMPIIKAAYGELGLFYLSAFLVGFNLVVWTICVFLFTGVNLRSLKEAINPGFLAAVLGTLLFLLRIKLPTPLAATVTQLGSLTTPLAMLLLGARLPQIEPQVFRNKALWIGNGIKLLVMPVLTLVAMRLLQFDSLVTAVVVISMAMPAPAVAQLFAEKYGHDIKMATTGISISTLLCVLTIPLVMLLEWLLAV